jgi:hypothetical protein
MATWQQRRWCESTACWPGVCPHGRRGCAEWSLLSSVPTCCWLRAQRVQFHALLGRTTLLLGVVNLCTGICMITHSYDLTYFSANMWIGFPSAFLLAISLTSQFLDSRER